MLVEPQKIRVRLSASNKKHYTSLGYDVPYGEYFEIDVKDLPLGSHQKVDVQCDYCGKIIHPVYRDYIQYKFDKYSCQSCRQRKTSDYNLKERQQSLYERAKVYCDEMGYVLATPIEEVNTADSRVICICPKHGEREVKIYNLITHHACPFCMQEINAEKQKTPLDNILTLFKECNTTILNPEEYIEWNTKNLQVVCPKCNEVFVTSFAAFRKGRGQVCPSCSSAMSKGERRVKQYLEDNKIEYIQEYSFSDCRNKNPLPFDFYLPKYNCCIEYDGEGHYMCIPFSSDKEKAKMHFQEGLKRDSIKNDYCEENNIQLIRIPYWEYNNIDTHLDNHLLHRDIV